jgi:hypothetical protein
MLSGLTLYCNIVAAGEAVSEEENSGEDEDKIFGEDNDEGSVSKPKKGKGKRKGAADSVPK